MTGYSLRNSEDPNELIIYCHQCRKEIKADMRMAKNLTPNPNTCWDTKAGEPNQQSLLWDRMIDNHEPDCNPTP